LWHGYVAPGNVTLLTSQWKSGKTTLVSVLLDRMKAGGLLGGLPVRPGRAVVVTEESAAHWYRRSQRFAFGDHVCWLCRPFRGRPRPAEWLGLLDRLAEMRHDYAIDLAVIDPLSAFLPAASENQAGGMLDMLLPLQRLTALGLAVQLVHHPRKGTTLDGQASRGSGALPGYVDVQIEMSWCGRPSHDNRRRRLQAWSRWDETPRRLVLELNAAGTDYTVCDDPGDDSSDSLDAVQAVLAAAAEPLTRDEILARWPAGQPVPERTTLWRWLDRACEQGATRRDGSGRRGDPYRYGVAGISFEQLLTNLGITGEEAERYLRAHRGEK
jgi:hypothetical protein